MKITKFASTDAIVSSFNGENKDGRKTKINKEESDRLEAFKSRVLTNHEENIIANTERTIANMEAIIGPFKEHYSTEGPLHVFVPNNL